MDTNSQKETTPVVAINNNNDNNNDPLQEALIAAKLMRELHKGPNMIEVRENNIPDRLEKDGVATSADDAGE